MPFRRTIHEFHQSYRVFLALAKKAPIERRERYLKLARFGLSIAEAQLRNPALRPPRPLKSDQGPGT